MKKWTEKMVIYTLCVNELVTTMRNWVSVLSETSECTSVLPYQKTVIPRMLSVVH